MSKNLKIFLGISYLIILFAFLYFIFTVIEISRLNDFSYYKELQEDFEQLKSIMEDSGSSEPRSVESLEDQYDKGSVSL